MVHKVHALYTVSSQLMLNLDRRVMGLNETLVEAKIRNTHNQV